jgi:hypothetical protein
MGDKLTSLLIVANIIITAAYLYEGNIPKVLYFGGATILTIGVLMMK